MVQLIATPMTLAEFLTGDDGTDQLHELIDGVPAPISEPTAKHEDGVDGLCMVLTEHCRSLTLPYVPKRSQQVRIKTEPGERETFRRADLVVFAQAEWQRLRESSGSAMAYEAPPMVVEVVSTNWRDDYLTQLAEYEATGIAEYWIVDYAGYGGVRYIGSPKQPTVTVYRLHSGEYWPGQIFKTNERIVSGFFQIWT